MPFRKGETELPRSFSTVIVVSMYVKYGQNGEAIQKKLDKKN